MNRLIFLSVLFLGILHSSFSFAEEEAVKLLTTGAFVKIDKGGLFYTDDKDKKIYYGFNMGVKEMVGDLVGEKVKLYAEVIRKRVRR